MIIFKYYEESVYEYTALVPRIVRTFSVELATIKTLHLGPVHSSKRGEGRYSRLLNRRRGNEILADHDLLMEFFQEIEMVCRQLYLTISTDLQVYPLYSALSNEDQQRVFEPLTSNVDGAYPGWSFEFTDS